MRGPFSGPRVQYFRQTPRLPNPDSYTPDSCRLGFQVTRCTLPSKLDRGLNTRFPRSSAKADKLLGTWGWRRGWGGEASPKHPLSHPWPGTRSRRTFRGPAPQAHSAAPAPGQWVPPVQPHPRSRASERLPSPGGQVSRPGSGCPSPPPTPRGLLTLLRTPQRSTGGPDSVSGSSSEPDEFQLWLSDMEARQASRRPAPAPRAAPVQAPSPWGEGSGDGTARSARSGTSGNRKRDEVRPPRRRRCRA